MRSICAAPRNCCARSVRCCASPSHSRTRGDRAVGGPAYVYYLVEAVVDTGILLGIPRSAALEMVIQTVCGAATMLGESCEHPVPLREAGTSPLGSHRLGRP